MPSTPWPAVVKRFVDGNAADAAYFNSILDVHTRRTDHLLERFSELEDKGALLAHDVPVLNNLVQIYSTVTYKTNGNSKGLDYAYPAIEPSDFNSFYKLGNDAYVFGIVRDVSGPPGQDGNTATVWTHGLVEAKDGNGDPYDIVQWLLDVPDTNFKSGPLFLSSLAAGKLTQRPSGIVVFVGYVIDRTRIYLAPKTDSHSDFFFNFRHPLLDRPAGTPVYNSGTDTWTITGGNTNRLGWLPATVGDQGWPVEEYDGAVFKYNIPPPSQIDADVSLSEVEKADAKSLYRSFPPRPAQFNQLAVNGVMQPRRREATDEGIYHVNEYGIWWYANSGNKQPWSSDITYGTAMLLHVVTAGTSTFKLQKNGQDVEHPFVGGELIQVVANTPTALPSGMAASTDYQVNLVSGDATNFKLKVFSGGSWIDIAGLGTGLSKISFTPSMWPVWKGSSNLRPLMDFQFVQMNPEYRSALVTSLEVSNTSNNDSTSAIRLLNENGDEANVGDLRIEFNLPVVSTAETTSTGVGVKSLSYDAAAGKMNVVSGPVVSSVTGLGRVKAYPVGSTGGIEVAVDDSDLGGLVTSIEVEQARLEYKGLHSYLRLDYASLPAGFIGKILLPAQLPQVRDLKIKLLAFAGDNTTETRRNVRLKFEYSVTSPSATAITSGTLPSVVTPFVYQLPYAGNAGKDKVFELDHASFTVPFASLVPNGILNFRINALAPAVGGESTAFDKHFCIIAARWLISV